MKISDAEKIDMSTNIYIKEWCDGNGNLGPCMCADGNKAERGHWRLSRSITLEEALKLVAERQREACAVYMRGPEDLATTIDRANADYIRATPLVTEEES